MARNFSELAERVSATWSADAQRVYDETVADLLAEGKAQAELGAQLQRARKQRALTQADVARITSLQQAEISRIERGLGNPTAATLLRLSAATGQRLVLADAS